MRKLISGKMSKLHSALLALAGLMYLAYLIGPIWRISLEAPQYPEGLSLEIWANRLGGDITTVNILNHYIGMAQIDAASFPELRFFPAVFLAFSGLAISAAVLRRNILGSLWALLSLAFLSWALFDFYSWEYKFGHELNPDAAIKMDDMVYQPPLIGVKTFLNITASSWPGLAGVAIGLSALIAVVFLWRTARGGNANVSE